MSLAAREALNKLISNAEVQQFAAHAEDWSACSTTYRRTGLNPARWITERFGASGAPQNRASLRSLLALATGMCVVRD